MTIRHILSARDLVSDELGIIFDYAKYLKRKNFDQFGSPRGTTLKDGNFLRLFMESSTRTNTSFGSAIFHLGGTSEMIQDPTISLALAKGESLEDSYRILSNSYHGIILRSKNAGEAALASRVSRVPIINAGDGNNEHPTQAFLDLYTIWECTKDPVFPKESLHVVFFGDNLHSRTVRSLALLIARRSGPLKINIGKVTFVGLPDIGAPREDTRLALEHAGIEYEVMSGEPPLDADIVYVTRSQDERHLPGEGGRVLVYKPEYALALPEHAKIMHPLPRNSELPKELDENPRAHWETQAQNGIPVRMGVLNLLYGGMKSMLN